LHRAIERDEALVQHWLKKEYPKIKAMVRKEEAEIYFFEMRHQCQPEAPNGRVWAQTAAGSHEAVSGLSDVERLASSGKSRVGVSAMGRRPARNARTMSGAR
jgi:hypothetical protein